VADHITTLAEDKFYHDRIVLAATSPYQRIVVTNGRTGHKLFLNGNLQFSERDEYRYHEALVHPAMAAFGAPRKVAVLGGGDGMAVREILKYPSVESVTLVELDPNMTSLFAKDPAMASLNGGALSSPKLNIVNADAFQWLQGDDKAELELFDVVVVDFPDPTNFSIGKLYTNSFYSLLSQRLSASGYAVIQTTSPLVARQSFWTVAATIESVGLHATPYHANVPSFGEWGYIIASHRPWLMPVKLPEGLRFLGTKTLSQLFDFPKDMSRVPAEINRLSNQVLVTTYEQEWGRTGL
jgi:spermidine synthase